MQMWGVSIERPSRGKLLSSRWRRNFSGGLCVSIHGVTEGVHVADYASR
jgi:hypothetical protein